VKFLHTLVVPLLIATLAAPLPAADFAESIFKAGQKAERAGDKLHALLLYSRAAEADPRNATYAAKKLALQNAAINSATATLGPDPLTLVPPPPAAADPDDFDDPDDPSAAIDPAQPATPPEPPAENVNLLEIKEAREALAPKRLNASKERKTFDLKGDARMIFEKVAGEYGITVVFEADYQSPQPFTFRMADAGYEEALRGLEAVADSFLIILTPKAILVSRDTPQKRAEREPVVATIIEIPERISAQEAQEYVQAVQTTMEIRRIAMDPVKRVIFVRDRETRVMAARQIIATLSRARTQVSIEVDFIETSKTSSLTYGMNLPNQFSLVNFGSFMHNTPATQGFSKFLTFGGGATLIGLGVTDALAFATISKATANNLLQAQMVALDGQATSLHVGQHYPIVTNKYVGDTSASNSGNAGTQVFTPPPTINFEDLGLVMKITPSVQEGDEVSLDVDAEFKVLGADTGVGIPIISNRKFAGKVRLKNGEWGVLAGLVTSSASEARSGYPGIMSVPVLGRVTGSTTNQKDSSEVLLVIKPRLMNLPPWEFPAKTIWVGTESRPLTIF
jgi:general secretion pathway protein D